MLCQYPYRAVKSPLDLTEGAGPERLYNAGQGVLFCIPKVICILK